MILGHYYNSLSLHSVQHGTTLREEGGLIISFEECEILDRKKGRKQLSFSIKKQWKQYEHQQFERQWRSGCSRAKHSAGVGNGPSM